MELSSILSGMQSCVGRYTMQKALNRDARSMAALLQDMDAAVPAPPPAGRLDIRG